MTDEKKPPEEDEDGLDILNLGKDLGEVYIASEPEFVGKIPDRKEPIVIGPDKPKEATVGFEVREVQGTEIVRVPDDLQKRDPDSLSEAEMDRLKALTERRRENRLKSFDDLKVGDRILTQSWGGWAMSQVDELRPEKKNGSSLSPEGGTLYMLKFDDDERQCWACFGHGNLIGLKSLTMKS